MNVDQRRNLPSETRLRVLGRDGFSCRYCGQESSEMVVDHVIPVASGGSDKDDNLVAACKRCNSKKSDYPAQKLIASTSEELREWWNEFFSNPPKTPTKKGVGTEFQAHLSKRGRPAFGASKPRAELKSFRLSAKARALLATLTEDSGLSQASVIEVALRDMAKARGLKTQNEATQ